MNIHSNEYPEPIVRLLNENKYLKEELKEEKGKLENTIGILRRELEETKEDNRKLNNQIEHYLKKKEKIYHTI
jgi:septal ring factor EnvC (AmiA/AmiB activator)